MGHRRRANNLGLDVTAASAVRLPNADRRHREWSPVTERMFRERIQEQSQEFLIRRECND